MQQRYLHKQFETFNIQCYYIRESAIPIARIIGIRSHMKKKSYVYDFSINMLFNMRNVI